MLSRTSFSKQFFKKNSSIFEKTTKNLQNNLKISNNYNISNISHRKYSNAFSRGKTSSTTTSPTSPSFLSPFSSPTTGQSSVVTSKGSFPWWNRWTPSRSVFSLEPLKYGLARGFRPVIGVRALDVHYNKILANQITTLNLLIAGTQYEWAPIEFVVRESCGKIIDAAIFQTASEVWNHTFYFKSLRPDGTVPSRDIKELIELNFESWDNFKKNLKIMAKSLFGNGWVWLVYHNGQLELMVTRLSETPLLFGEDIAPILGIDCWEHAYFYEYFNDIEKYIDNFIHGVDWGVVEERIVEAEKFMRKKNS
jgi:Fe-Mn family superoxide dismutase